MRISCGFLLYCTILVLFLVILRALCLPSTYAIYAPHPLICLYSIPPHAFIFFALICTINWPHFSDPKWRIRCQKSCKQNILLRFHAPKNKSEIFVDGCTEHRCLFLCGVLLFNRLDHLVDLCTSNLHLVPPAPAQCGVARPCHTSNIQTVRFCSYGVPWLIQPGSQGISCEENGLMSRRRLA